jgi:hypothetical protein
VAAGWVDEAVGPFALQDAYECFGFAVGAGRVGAGADVADAVGLQEVVKRVGAVSAAVVGQDALDGCAAVVVRGDYGVQKLGAVIAAF